MGRNKPDTWFLGIDLGTGSCKSVVVDENTRILGFGVSGYSGDDIRSKWKEQNPDAMVTGMIRSANSAIADAGVSARHCAGLSLGSALHGILSVDHQGNPLTGVMTWADDRASSQAKMIKESSEAESLYKQTGCPVHWMYPLYKILWLRERKPGVFKKTDRFISAKEYITRRFIGDYLVDYSLASGSGLLNIHTLSWSKTALDSVGIGTNHLSDLCRPTETFNKIDAQLAEAIGIPPTTPFVLGSSDAVNSNLGAGAVKAWQGTCMVGTSGALRIISPKPILDHDSRSWCYVIDTDRWLVGGAINNGGVALSWLQDALNSALGASNQDGPLSYDNLVHMAEQVSSGARGVICLPFFAGERSPNWNLNARAMFFGLTLEHDARHIARALLEGVAFRMRGLNDVLCEISGDIRQVRASGGFTRSPLWLQIISDTLNRELVVPAWGETSSLGAAVWALLGAGALSSFEQMGERVAISETYRPDTKKASLLDRQYELHKSLYEAVSPLFDSVAELQDRLSG